ncbi:MULTISPECIES: AIPR family protein [unclassified Rathayibacter]|uniref:AIPR family protein n=1 Tax=unclassified Rathayibacter TaxID=2609250 RepID=UPI000CE93770|nr:MULTISPECIES: AIPR family protein [unclassified Rathayibacter]PPG78825.1 hypothetical protein C5C52_12930 [Rathayibacter sp. AY1E5]PPH31156.1 hypothetical protein C5C94_08785 [Rathayibacter sp. AY1C3]PPI33241.1 hypothetical protein C5D66_03430 [Rathayibacter sp. AY1B4]
MTFEEDLREQIALRAAGSSSFAVQAFGEELVERLEDAEVVFDATVEPLRCIGRRGRKLELLGSAEDSADDSLVIIVGTFRGTTGAVLTKSESDKIFGAGAAFLEHALDGWLTEHLEPSSREADYAAYLRDNLARFQRFKFLLVTDATLSARVTTINDEVVLDRPASYSIWDLRRFEELAASESGRDDIRLDLTEWMPEGLPCLVGAENGAEAQSYLAVLPGRVLADAFQRFGSQLLESNVRTFLSARGKVNKGIQTTLAEEPEMFLAYNNGLTTTASDVTVEQRDGGTYLTAIDNWQIVNGGQTTSSLAHFVRQAKDRSLDGVFVQMKLVKVAPVKAQELVAKVSRYANSQNKVSEADFFSNSPYHVKLEQISLRVKAPAKDGAQFTTGWFYERTRGQYENSKNALSAPEQKRFELEFPRAQVIAKTDWAKFAFSWDQKPHEVSRGAQSNFVAFAAETDRLWREASDAVDDEYFRHSIAKVIMYNRLRAAVMQSDWYSTGYLANIVAYAISKFAYELGRQMPGYRFDFERVWREQRLGPRTEAVLLDLAHAMHGVLTDPYRLQINVTQWAKQVACWDSAKKRRFVLPAAPVDELVEVGGAHAAAEAPQSDLDPAPQADPVQRVLDVPSAVWTTALGEGVERGIVSPIERAQIERLTAPGKPPTERQATRALAALARVAEHGLIAADAY